MDADQPAAAGEQTLRFRVGHIFYLVALCGSSFAVFGWEGALVAALVVFYWYIVLETDRHLRVRRFRLSLAIIACCLVYGLCLLPAVSTPPAVGRRFQCLNNLRQLALAIHSYHDNYGSFPPAFVCDDGGRPMHSWRVLILPYLGEQTLYNRYRFDEPWDGPNNSQLATSMPTSFYCPSCELEAARRGYSSYIAPVDDDTVWPHDRGRPIGEITDGTSEVVMLTESQHLARNWLDPTPIEAAEAIEKLGDELGPEHSYETYFTRYYTTSNVVMANGAVYAMPHGHDPHHYAQLLGVNDGSVDIEKRIRHRKRVRKFGNWYRLVVFTLIALLPAPWVWKKR